MHRKAWSSIAKTVYSLLWVILSPTNCQRPTSPISESFSLEFSPHADYVRDFQKFNWINFHYFLYCLIYLLASNWIPKLMKPVFFFFLLLFSFFPMKILSSLLSLRKHCVGIHCFGSFACSVQLCCLVAVSLECPHIK